MPKEKIRIICGGSVKIISNEYGPDEMPEYWAKDDRYIDDAKKKDMYCVVVECSESDAKKIAADFANDLFAIPTCTFYDGKELSLCCSYAGRWSSLRAATVELIEKKYPHLKVK